MKYLLIILVVSVLPIIAFWVGTRTATKPDLTRTERRELEKRRDFMSDLAAKAAEHAMLGDQFAVIVSDMLARERREAR